MEAIFIYYPHSVMIKVYPKINYLLNYEEF